MQTFDDVRSIVSSVLQVTPEEIKENTSFTKDLGVDSLGTVDLIIAFEEKYRIEISDEDAEKINTVKDAVEYIQKKINT